MNTYVQDEVIPIYIILQYSYFVMKFPINPEELKMTIPSESEEKEVEGLGKISIPKGPGLAKISINSFFWHQNNLVPGALYVKWLKMWQKNKKPAKLIVTRLNYSMDVTCDNFEYSTKAGEEKDIYFNLSMKEYKPYGARLLSEIKNANVLQKITSTLDGLAVPVLMDIPRPSRSSTNKKTYSNPYTVRKNESLMSITKTITGSTEKWKELYDENSKKLGDIISEGDIIEGTKLILPDSWIESKGESSLNI